MGQCSCDCGKPSDLQQSAPVNTTGRKKVNTEPSKRRKLRSASDSDSSDDWDDYSSTSQFLDIQNTPSLGPQKVQRSKESNERAIAAYKEAVEKGTESLVMYYVDEFPDLDPLHLKFENGDTCLHVAVRNCSYNLIYYLLNSGLSPNDQNSNNGETALHTAVRTRDIKVCALLCKYRADPCITNRSFETPLTIAGDNRDDDIQELLAPDTQAIIMDRLASVEAPDPDEQDHLNMPSTGLHAGQSSNSAMLHELADDILSDDGDDPVIPKNYLGRASTKSKVGTSDIEREIDSRPSLFNLSAFITKDDEKTVTDTEEKTAYDSTFAADMTDRQRLQMEALRVTRNNPFTAIGSKNTQRILGEIDQIAVNKGNLPVLEGWLEKKSTSMGQGYQKRWVVVKGSYFLWCDIQREIVNEKNLKERKKWNNFINLMSIKEVEAVTKGKSQRKFKIIYQGGNETRNRRKEYLWKCGTKEDRNYWVTGLKKHMAHVKSVISYLGTK